MKASAANAQFFSWDKGNVYRCLPDILYTWTKSYIKTSRLKRLILNRSVKVSLFPHLPYHPASHDHSVIRQFQLMEEEGKKWGKSSKQLAERHTNPWGARASKNGAVCVWCRDVATASFFVSFYLFFWTVSSPSRSPFIAVYANDRRYNECLFWYISTERQITSAAELHIINVKAAKCSHSKPSGKKAHGTYNYPSYVVKVTDRCLNCLHRCATD